MGGSRHVGRALRPQAGSHTLAAKTNGAQVFVALPGSKTPDLTMAYPCGHVLTLDERSRGRPRIHCPDCERVRVCVVCGSSMSGFPGHAVTCSNYCRHLNRYVPAGPKPCPDCGVEIPGRRNYCKPCADERVRLEKKNRRESPEIRARERQRYKERMENDPEYRARRRAQWLNDGVMRRRAKTRVTDLTAARIAELKRKAKVCAMCGETLSSEMSERHLEHIWPLTCGGTHTEDNVRITCGPCNLKRPKDGSDVVDHQLNLFMATDVAVELIAKRQKVCRHCGSSDLPPARVRKSRYECLRCAPPRPRGERRGPQPQRRVNEYRGKYDMAKVEQLAEEGKGYKAIAAELGMSRDVARALVRRCREIREREAAA